uniref:Uncharacterized protein n=1 Tax=Macrostomum lignano TaxID=282301 RepID=A0A1I8F3V3_9PLAT
MRDSQSQRRTLIHLLAEFEAKRCEGRRRFTGFVAEDTLVNYFGIVQPVLPTNPVPRRRASSQLKTKDNSEDEISRRQRGCWNWKVVPASIQRCSEFQKQQKQEPAADYQDQPANPERPARPYFLKLAAGRCRSAHASINCTGATELQFEPRTVEHAASASQRSWSTRIVWNKRPSIGQMGAAGRMLPPILLVRIRLRLRERLNALILCLAETFEFDRTAGSGAGVILCEQVSHHTASCRVPRRGSKAGWIAYQEFGMSSKFRGKFLSVIPHGIAHLVFAESGHHYTWRKVTLTVHNIIVVANCGFDNHGEMDIVNHTTGDVCQTYLQTLFLFLSGDAAQRGGYVLTGTWDEMIARSPRVPPFDDTNQAKPVMETRQASVLWRRNPNLPNADKDAGNARSQLAAAADADSTSQLEDRPAAVLPGQLGAY